MRRLLREPALHFVAIGSLLFLALPEGRPIVEMSIAGRDAVVAEFTASAGRPPTADELAVGLRNATDERMLHAEALRIGLDRGDSAVVTRLARIGGFVATEPDRNAAESVARARSLGLHRTDPVVRRYLAERMRQTLARGGGAPEPSSAELEAHLAAHPERFAAPERIALQQVFRRGPADADADAAFAAHLASLPSERAGSAGDAFALPARAVGSLAEIGRDFGPGFAAGIDVSRVGTWQGPIASAHGRHWVRVESFEPARPARLVDVRARVASDWQAERRDARLARRLAELRERYEVRLPEGG